MPLTKVSYSMIQGSPVNVLDYGADPTGSADSTAAIQAAIDTNGTVWIPNGTYSITTLDLKQKYPNIIGESTNGTILKARSSVQSMIDAYETIDGQVTPLYISNLTFDGNDLIAASGACIRMRFRHMSNIENCYFHNANSISANGIFALDTWLTSINNCRFTLCYNGLQLGGSNHRSTTNSCSFTACSNAGIVCDSQGTALDGNSSLAFNNCDVEFGTGLGVFLNVTDAAFYSCYMGEALEGPSYFVNNGNILVEGGIVFFGHTTVANAVTGNGGYVLFDKCHVAGQTHGSITYLIGGNLKNYYKWQNCTFGIVLGGEQTSAGDVLDYGPPAIVFAQRLGKNYTPVSLNVTTTVTTSDKSQRITCNTVTGATPIIGLNCNLINFNERITTENLYIVIVYKMKCVSGVPDIRISGSSLGGLPTNVLGNPTQSDTFCTYYKLDVAAVGGSSFNVFEFLLVGCAAGDYLEIQECFLADNRMLQKSGANVMTNLYKC